MLLDGFVLLARLCVSPLGVNKVIVLFFFFLVDLTLRGSCRHNLLRVQRNTTGNSSVYQVPSAGKRRAYNSKKVTVAIEYVPQQNLYTYIYYELVPARKSRSLSSSDFCTIK